jgi:FkbM family methyltransferase
MTRKNGGIFSRCWRLLQKPSSQKSRSLYLQCRRVFPDMSFPIRLPFGAWWLARNDYAGRIILEGQFESAEFAFVSRFLRPGMSVLDIGAHHGFYTLLLSRRVGPEGKVFAFEPSPREKSALLWHVRINRCKNVTVEGLALGSQKEEARLFVVQGEQTGCNSLRTPAQDVSGEFTHTPVHVVRLDDWLAEHKIERLDFIKLDVEGGELEVLRGAVELFEKAPRPVLLVEVQDLRTKPWGYRAIEIINFLSQKRYKWFRITVDGSLQELDVSAQEFDENLVAAPLEIEKQLPAYCVSQVEQAILS